MQMEAEDRACVFVFTDFNSHHWQVGLQGRWQGLLAQGAGPGAGLESDCY